MKIGQVVQTDEGYRGRVIGCFNGYNGLDPMEVAVLFPSALDNSGFPIILVFDIDELEVL